MAAREAQLIRALLIAVSILAACTNFPPFGRKSEPAVTPEVIPEPVTEVTIEDSRTKRAPPKPKRVKTPAPITPTEEPELVNPLDDCLNIAITDPKTAARARLDCMAEKLKITTDPK